MASISGEDVLLARNDEAKRNNFIRENEQTILQIASKTCRRYITKEDDEWAVALYAFSAAMDKYEESRGTFGAFAGVSIEHALVDFYRKNKNQAQEISVSMDETAENSSEVVTAEEYSAANAMREQGILHYHEEERTRNLRAEITEVNECLRKWGFSFFELAECSPKQQRSKDGCAAVLRYLLQQPGLMADILKSGQLPFREILKATKVPKKIPERHRKYILMAAVVLNGDFPLLAEYLKFVRKEGDA